ncbi:right-handed parallel beta-helix repeat-containing protein [Sphingobium sp. H33]|uniref:Right-handed parallel beta-helix repeat-containing protein n=2 Tax=Sphingobium nicotianae TaxID=2782607 RepID=A0A9X1IT54_9SPHN|nr:right-handed parallel beta-helix repeat-containing protein [Sphingobium nicotianae]
MAGSAWREPLLLTHSGTAEAPITITRGGEGPRPRIEVGGVAENAVEIRNADNIAVSGLELTNTGPGTGLRRGVFINAIDFGVATNIALRDLYIHDIKGTNERKDNGGIVFSALGPAVPTRFEGITIERNLLWKVDRSGIAGISDQVSVARWFPSRFVVIRDNVLEDIGGDGIVARGADGTLIEHNIVRHAASRAPGYNVAIWQWSTDNTLIQLNEAAFTHGIYDGMGFDSDFNSRNTTLLSNFSHDNEGGFLLICTPVVRDPVENIGNSGTLVRQNVSYNDRERIIQLGGASDALIEKNVIHAGPGEVQMVVATWWDGWSERITLRDNLLGTRGTAHYGYETGRSGGHYVASPGFPPPLSVAFDGNVYAGEHLDRPADATGREKSAREPRPEQWAVPVLDPARPDDLPGFLARHRAWMLAMLRRELGERPALEQPRLMMPVDYRRR